MEADHEEGMKRLHEDCVWIKYFFWKVLGMERPDPETILIECRDK